MFAVTVDFLTGAYRAARFDDRNRAEWPPHPARLFFAMVAVLHESSNPDPLERNALEWLESLPPPSLCVPEAEQRTSVAWFVPINDDAGNCLQRVRKERAFPVAFPAVARMSFVWSKDPEPRVRTAVAGLLGRVHRLGHSASLVSCTVNERPGVPNLVPREDGESVLRVPAKGLLASLEAEFERHREIQPRVLPAGTQRYGPAEFREGAFPRGVFQPEIVVLRRVKGARFPVTAAGRLAAVLRAALMASADQPPLEVLSGHTEDGRPGEVPHMAVIALPFAGHQHADGSILGLGLVIPRNAGDRERRHLLRAVGRLEEKGGGLIRLQLGRAGEWTLERVKGVSTSWNLNPAVWCRASRHWVSVTPVVLDRFPRALRKNAGRPQGFHEVEETIARSAEFVGLPRPIFVQAASTPWSRGIPPSWAFPPYRKEPSRPARLHFHARMEFSGEVAGPILLGAGRYQGYGLFRPCGRDHEE